MRAMWWAITVVVLLSIGCASSIPVVREVRYSDGYQELSAFRAAFPNRINTLAFRDGQWAIRIDTRWFYWAYGRILPASQRRSWREYVPIYLYEYQIGQWRSASQSRYHATLLAARAAVPETTTRVRSNEFLETLYGIRDQEEASARMERVSFFGMETHVHPMVVEPLMRVEFDLRVLARRDNDLREYIASLSEIQGYNWRTIAGTPRRSYHSYGMAVDLIPDDWMAVGWGYWRWARDGGRREWWKIPNALRFYVPQVMIDAFERHGFVWGGKWYYFDNMHFEYRPESIKLSGQRTPPFLSIRSPHATVP